MPGTKALNELQKKTTKHIDYFKGTVRVFKRYP